MTTNQPETIESRFRKKFVRDDGLMDKYSYEGSKEEDLGPRFMADAILEFIHEEVAAQEQKSEANRWVMPCSGCPSGHPSFWKTIIESKEWKVWEKENHKDPQFDIDESRELGALGERHRDAFFDFIRKQI